MRVAHFPIATPKDDTSPIWRFQPSKHWLRPSCCSHWQLNASLPRHLWASCHSLTTIWSTGSMWGRSTPHDFPVGDGHQSYFVGGLYTYYKDSLFRVGWPTPQKSDFDHLVHEMELRPFQITVPLPGFQCLHGVDFEHRQGKYGKMIFVGLKLGSPAPWRYKLQKRLMKWWWEAVDSRRILILIRYVWFVV